MMARAESGFISRPKIDDRCGSSLICHRDGIVIKTLRPCLTIVVLPENNKLIKMRLTKQWLSKML